MNGILSKIYPDLKPKEGQCIVSRRNKYYFRDSHKDFSYQRGSPRSSKGQQVAIHM